MEPHGSPSPFKNFKPTVFAAALAVFFLTLCAVGIVSSTAQSTQKEERELEDKIPKHLPLKVKVKNLKSEKWARDVEVEITNTGDKPIYYLRMSLSLPDVFTENNRNLGFPISYGRDDFIDFEERLQSGDVPIKPGESYTIKISEDLQQGWERFVKRRGVSKDEPKKVRLVFKLLNFGDGTGFNTVDGMPIDLHQSQVSAPCAGEEKQGENITSALYEPPNRSPDLSFQPSTLFLPASFLPVKLSLAKNHKPTANASFTSPDICGCSGACNRLIDVKVTCCGKTINKVGSASCSDPRGRCATYYTEDVSCNDEFGTYCIEDTLLTCPSQPPTPTPTPAPTSTPTPCPTPPDSSQPNPTCYRFGPACAQIWQCTQCGEGQLPVNKPVYGEYGCPDGYYNNGNNCCVPVTGGGGGGGGNCTTPGWNGTCPYGTYPNNGMCCSGDCNGAAALAAPEMSASLTAAPGSGGGCPADYVWDGCQCLPASPIILDLDGNGFHLTAAQGGVNFDMNGDRTPERLAWTSLNSADAWLTLDRNANGTVDNGAELFGNFTPQPAPPAGAEKNGFLALAVYDRTGNGGNADDVIDAHDSIFSRLRLWRDVNHNGASEASELHSLPSLGVVSLHLAYKESKRVDEHGNQFKYRAKLNDAKGAKVSRWAWDVFLVTAASR